MSKQHRWMKVFVLLMMCSVFFLAACTNKDTETEAKQEDVKKEEKPLDGKEIIQKMNELYAKTDSFAMKVRTTVGTEEMIRYDLKAQLKPTEAAAITVYDAEIGEINGVHINNLTYVKAADMKSWEHIPAEDEFAMLLREAMKSAKLSDTYNQEFMDTIDSTEVKQEGDDHVLRIKMNPDKFTLLMAKQQGVAGKFTTAAVVLTVDSKTYIPKKATMSLEVEEKGVKVPTVTEMEYHSINEVPEIKAPK
jgi:outer membrane lipoprotein-sorting protein